jgi:hypothetical protein
MNISSQRIARPAMKPMPAPAKAPEAQEKTTFSGDSVGWGDAAVGLVTGVTTGVVTGVGAGLSSVKHSLLGTVEGYKALYTNETIGPWLKTAIGALMPIATVGVPVLSAIGGAAYGLYSGFVEGATEGFGAGLAQGFEDVSDFNKEIMPLIREEIREFGDEKLREGEEKFDISPVRAGEAIIAGAGNTVVGGVGFGLSTISQIPEAFLIANRAIAKSDMGLPLKTVSHAVSVPLAALAAPVGIAGGALVGLGFGAYKGYEEGLVESFKQTGELVGDYHEAVDNGLAELAEELVNDPY